MAGSTSSASVNEHSVSVWDISVVKTSRHEIPCRRCEQNRNDHVLSQLSGLLLYWCRRWNKRSEILRRGPLWKLNMVWTSRTSFPSAFYAPKRRFWFGCSVLVFSTVVTLAIELSRIAAQHNDSRNLFAALEWLSSLAPWWVVAVWGEIPNSFSPTWLHHCARCEWTW